MTWIERISAALNSDISFSVEDERVLGLIEHRAAAVLIPITNRPEPGVILTQRPDWLRSHAGQVAFPGGKIDEDDTGPISAALREAHKNCRSLLMMSRSWAWPTPITLAAVIA